MWIADISKGWPTLTGAVLKSLGASGVIGYAGCIDTTKNVSKVRFDDWLSSGLSVALVIENQAEDLKGGTVVGTQQGKALLAAAKQLGYDYSNCVLFASADWNSRGSDLTAIEAAMAAFGNYIPIPGLYGNSYALDQCHNSGTSKVGWQSESASFSYGLSPNASLQQIFNDPRAQGHSLDVNNIIKEPLLFMGDSMSVNGPQNWDANDWAAFSTHYPGLSVAMTDPNQNPSIGTITKQIHDIRYGDDTHPGTTIEFVSNQLDTVLAAIKAIPAPVVNGNISGTITGTVTGP